MTEPTEHQTSVMIVGGGVTGLSAALFLARRGIRPILVERHPSTAITPQARAFNPRSMEIYRALGLEQEILGHTSILADMPSMIGADTVTGVERFQVNLLDGLRPDPTVSATDWAMVDQDDLERILRARAVESGADVRFGTELTSFEPDETGVTAMVRELDGGAEHRIRADYLIAADGNRAGIRRHLGVGADQHGEAVLAIYFLFDADLTDALRGRRFLLCYLDQPTPGTVLVPMQRHGRWMLGVPGLGEDLDDLTAERCAELARLAVGDHDLELTLVPPVPGWDRLVSTSRLGAWVADRFRVGRVFIAGDAAHVVPPSGSYGANTGIADAHNLAWKLAAVLDGPAGDELLETYEDERRPVAQVTLRTALRLMGDRSSAVGDEAHQVDDLAMIFGYRYDSAGIQRETSTPDGPVEDPRKPSGRPGLRAPHVWLERGGERLSTTDLTGRTASLLVGPDGAGWVGAAEAVATSLGVDLAVHRIGADLRDVENRWASAYGVGDTGASLIRPDGFVAWRAAELPQRPDDTLRRAVSGMLALGDSRESPS